MSEAVRFWKLHKISITTPRFIIQYYCLRKSMTGKCWFDVFNISRWNSLFQMCNWNPVRIVLYCRHIVAIFPQKRSRHWISVDCGGYEWSTFIVTNHLFNLLKYSWPRNTWVNHSQEGNNFLLYTLDERRFSIWLWNRDDGNALICWLRDWFNYILFFHIQFIFYFVTGRSTQRKTKSTNVVHFCDIVWHFSFA